MGRFQTYEPYHQRHPEIKKIEQEFDLKGGQPRLENTRYMRNDRDRRYRGRLKLQEKQACVVER